MTLFKQPFLLLLFIAAVFFQLNGVTCTPVVQQVKEILDVDSLSSYQGVRTSLGDRTTCQDGADVPPSRVDTSERIIKLRDQMLAKNINAYIIPSSDAHQSEYVANADERRKFISGFGGSAGTAIVTRDKQALWTDGRYFLQAENELDCHWILMKEGEEGVPSLLDWLKSELASGETVGADSKLINSRTWINYIDSLEASNINMMEIEENLVDTIWIERPPYEESELFVLDMKYAGKSWEDKVQEVRNSMNNEGGDMLVVAALDEIAWLLNLRGSDIPFTPVFRAYLTLTLDEVNLYIPTSKQTQTIKDHLTSVNIKNYDEIWTDLENSAATKIMVPNTFAGVSYALYSKVSDTSRLLVTSPVMFLKAQKNEVEIQGMKNAHIRDAVALCDFLSHIEKEVTSGSSNITEIYAAQLLSAYRAEQDFNMGDSFSAISGFGPNGAIIHYEPSEATDAKIDTSSMYLLDSGGQYLDGTTDVTRAMHYGNPTSFMIETYTRVLMGHIDLASVVFPEGTGDNKLDILARGPLFEVGLDFNHGTGHGIGMFLGVHEDPTSIAIYSSNPYEIKSGYFFSNEPGYYEDNEFGIRLENIMTAVTTETTYDNQPMLALEAVTLVPFEPNLINTTLLSEKQCDYLNNYHARVLGVVGTKLLEQSRNEAYEWLRGKTEKLCQAESKSTATSVSVLVLLVALSSTILF